MVDLAVGVITSTFFYYLLVYLGEWKRSKGVRRVIQWRLNAIAQNMEIIIGYYVWKHSVDYNERNPSKYVAEERLMVHFLKRGRKMINAGELPEPRLSQFLELLELCEKYKRKNQYM